MMFLTNTLSATTSASMSFGLDHPLAFSSNSSSLELSSYLKSDAGFCSRSLCTGAPRVHRRQRGFMAIRAAERAFFESNVVQAESDNLQAAYSALLKLGRRYGKFDREGKISYLQEMKNLVERWQIFVKRMELVDDFSAKFVLKKLRTEVGPLGLTNLDLADSMHVLLDEMRCDAETEIA